MHVLVNQTIGTRTVIPVAVLALTVSGSHLSNPSNRRVKPPRAPVRTRITRSRAGAATESVTNVPGVKPVPVTASLSAAPIVSFGEAPLAAPAAPESTRRAAEHIPRTVILTSGV